MNTQKIQEAKQRFGVIGNSPELLRAIDIALQVAPTDLSVLITGESGVGKEHFPKIIHQYSARKHNKYIAVNCGAIPEGTIDSELFGHEKGSFTGAISERNGYFAEANGGTIFLDEIGELPLSTQARLLRVLESGEYIKVGSSTVQKTNVRIVAATNVDLTEAIAQGRFRQDLFYRLSTIPIRVPALRERPGDIELLFRKFAFEVAEKYTIPNIHLTEQAKEKLLSYPWPGNVRQLKNITEQISLLSEQREITAEILDDYLPPVAKNLPVMFGIDAGQKDSSFANERQILYQILFDMRRDVTNLREQLNELMKNKVADIPAPDYSPEPKATTIDISGAGAHPYQSINEKGAPLHHSTIDGEAETVEETLSIQEGERELIRRALERHRGRRKFAAKDLGISERTLYRKIKALEIDDI
ncbi:MAG: sigma-54-dependent Fis family transcriptional regulator [Bacteroidaceae bacterium]|nr:sigma-54-dependent Fis family transcriptional regulator [Bacteroidaceae bacterium]